MDDLERRVGKNEAEIRVLSTRLDSAEAWVETSKEFHVEMRRYIDEERGYRRSQDQVQELRHKENIDRSNSLSSRMTLWNLAMTLIGLIIALCMLFLAVKAAQHAQSDPAKIFHSSLGNPVVASDQDASGGEYVPRP